MFILGDNLPPDFDWREYDKQKLARRRIIEARRAYLRNHLGNLQRIGQGGATNYVADQALIQMCVQHVFEEVSEDIRETFELTHRHRDRTPPPPPPDPAGPATDTASPTGS